MALLAEDLSQLKIGDMLYVNDSGNTARYYDIVLSVNAEDNKILIYDTKYKTVIDESFSTYMHFSVMPGKPHK